MTDEDFKYMDELRKTIHRQEAEIERFKNDCFGLANERDAYKDVLDTAVTEAIKEFADRLKEKSNNAYWYDYSKNKQICRKIIYTDDIDNLVKEMVGEDL